MSNNGHKRKAAGQSDLRNVTQKPNQTETPSHGGEKPTGKTATLAVHDSLKNWVT